MAINVIIGAVEPISVEIGLPAAPTISVEIGNQAVDPILVEVGQPDAPSISLEIGNEAAEPILVEIGQTTAPTITVEIGNQPAESILVEIGGLLGPPGPDGSLVHPGFTYTRGDSSNSQQFDTLAAGEPYTENDPSLVTSLRFNRSQPGFENLWMIQEGDILHVCGVNTVAVFSVLSVTGPSMSNLIIPAVYLGAGILPSIGSTCGIFVSRRGSPGDPGAQGDAGSGLAWVTLTEDDFEDLATPDSDTIYDVLLPGETP